MSKPMKNVKLVCILREYLRPDAKPWVLFEHGTFVFVPESVQDVSEAAIQLLKKWGPAYSQCGSAGEITKGWIVESEHEDIMTLIPKSELGEDAETHIVVILGRQKRFHDADELKIMHVEE